jgi:hypothetical protein
MLSFLFRTGNDSRNVHSFKIIYFSYVRSHLGYCCQIWNPIKTTYSAELEKIQKKFVRYLFFKNMIPNNSPYTNLNLMCNEFSYSSCLNDLQLQSLNERRKFFYIDLILKTFTYQIDSTRFVGFFKFPTQLHDLLHHNSFLTSSTKE